MVEDSAELALAIRQVTLAVQRYRLRAARALFDVGASEMMALSQLFTAGTCSPTELAAFLSMTTASVTSLLDRLQRAGHVVRRPHPSDRRRVLVELTPRARDTITAMFAFTSTATAHAARSMSPSELSVALRFLHTVSEAYDRIDPIAGLPENFVGRGDAPPVSRMKRLARHRRDRCDQPGTAQRGPEYRERVERSAPAWVLPQRPRLPIPPGGWHRRVPPSSPVRAPLQRAKSLLQPSLGSPETAEAPIRRRGECVATYTSTAKPLLYRCLDRARAEQHLYPYYPLAGVPELERLSARSIPGAASCSPTYFDTDRISNGPTEAVNLLIKKIKRVGDSGQTNLPVGGHRISSSADS